MSATTEMVTTRMGSNLFDEDIGQSALLSGFRGWRDTPRSYSLSSTDAILDQEEEQADAVDESIIVTVSPAAVGWGPSMRLSDEWRVDLRTRLLRGFLAAAATITLTDEQEWEPGVNRVWRGVFRPTLPREVIAENRIEFRVSELPTWKPRVAIGRRTLEDSDV